MVEVEKRGISAIAAATMIATRTDENPAANNVEFIRKNFSKLNASLWNMIKNDQVNIGLTESNRKISHAERIYHEIELERMRMESLQNIASAISTTYAAVLISIYIAFSFTELVTFPFMYRWLEIHGFFIYMYLISIAYLLYLILYVLNGRVIHSNPKVVENCEVRHIYLLFWLSF